jgi:hypothetical protein
MFRASSCPSSGATTTAVAASGLSLELGDSSAVGRGRAGRQFPLKLDYGRSPHAYVNEGLQIQLELLMMSGMPLETC